MPAYRLEVAKTGQASCNGKKPCKGTKIDKNQLRLGTWVVIRDRGAFKWRHWGCTTSEVFANMKKDFEAPSELDGFEELPTTYQEKVGNPMSDQSLLSTPSRSLKHGRTNTVRQTSRPLAKDAVAEEDIPETARIPPTEEGAPGGETRLESSPSKNKATPTKKKADVGAGGEPRKEKPKKPTAKKGQKSKAEEDEEDEKLTPPPDEEEEHKPKKTRKVPAGKKVKEEEEDEEENEKPAKGKKTNNIKRDKVQAGSEDPEEDEKPAKKSKPSKEGKPASKAKAAKEKKPASRNRHKAIVSDEDDG